MTRSPDWEALARKVAALTESAYRNCWANAIEDDRERSLIHALDDAHRLLQAALAEPVTAD